MAEQPPRKVIVLTLTLATQNKVLTVLSSVCGITESYPRPQQLIMWPAAYGIFVAKCMELEDPPTMKQIEGKLMKLNDIPEQRVVRNANWDTI